MTADHLSYQRATTVSVLGLCIQGVLATVVLLYGIFGQDPGATQAAYAMYLGLPIWFSLGLVFQQHKQERLEALEAEAFRASESAQASAFEGIAQDQTVQANRLAWMHKWFLPVMGVVVGGAYIALGLWTWNKSRTFGEAAEMTGAPSSGWAIAIGVGVAVLGFIFARFVAGMAKQKVWSLLHAGAAAAVLCSLAGVALVAAHFVFVALKADWGLRYMPLAMNVLMLALGAEMLLHFVLNLYRPRRAGEYLRPAFDSRVLAFAAAPDRLAASLSDAVNYQFGFNVSSTWFYRLLSRSVVPLVALVVLTLWMLTAFVVVRPDQRGLVLRNGEFAGEVAPGLVFKKPWPFDEVLVYPAASKNELIVGTTRPEKDEPILWTNQHSGEEVMMVVQPWGGTETARDLALLAVEVPIHYTIIDLKAYRLLAQDAAGTDTEKTRRDLLTGVASSVVIKHLGTYRVDQLLGDRRAAIADDLKTGIQGAFDAMSAGVKVSFVGVSGVHPKQDVAPAFERVVSADQNRQAEIERARREEIGTLARVAGDVDRAREIGRALDELRALRNAGDAKAQEADQKEAEVMALIEQAGGTAASRLANAKAERWERSIGERAKAVRIAGQLASYRAAPDAYRSGLFLDALREALRGAKVYVTPFNGIEIQGNFEDIQPDVSGFKPTTSTSDENNK